MGYFFKINHLVICALIFSLTFPTLGHGKKAEVTTRTVYDDLKIKKGTIKAILDSHKEDIPSDRYKFLRNKTKGLENKELKLSWRDKKILLEVDSQVIPFAVIDASKGQFEINAKKLVIQASDSNEIVWAKIQETLPNPKTSLFNLFVPKAHALPPHLLALGAGLGLLGFWAIETGHDAIDAMAAKVCREWQGILNRCGPIETELCSDIRKIRREQVGGDQPVRCESDLPADIALAALPQERLDAINRLYRDIEQRNEYNPVCYGRIKSVQMCRLGIERLLSKNFTNGKVFVHNKNEHHDLKILYTPPPDLPVRSNTPEVQTTN